MPNPRSYSNWWGTISCRSCGEYFEGVLKSWTKCPRCYERYKAHGRWESENPPEVYRCQLDSYYQRQAEQRQYYGIQGRIQEEKRRIEEQEINEQWAKEREAGVWGPEEYEAEQYHDEERKAKEREFEKQLTEEREAKRAQQDKPAAALIIETNEMVQANKIRRVRRIAWKMRYSKIKLLVSSLVSILVTLVVIGSILLVIVSAWLNRDNNDCGSSIEVCQMYYEDESNRWPY